ncbi:hypothetical protein PHLGIDRAFT_386178 [Phlebiopsis gigantea 11061_1 CR5-6]|uniref:Uncharacterized protein n=1 Tax=Phlebiopsis gigantea (strain 11061_1 CR5-6) TaxID=745531 RepID=A0A0C3NSI1_PHLG1|nr:hypothetical protein PHLGIDRAFT_386178 [Phlebiopsis gigantea 11061_1 CR5-6]
MVGRAVDGHGTQTGLCACAIRLLDLCSTRTAPWSLHPEAPAGPALVVRFTDARCVRLERERRRRGAADAVRVGRRVALRPRLSLHTTPSVSADFDSISFRYSATPSPAATSQYTLLELLRAGEGWDSESLVARRRRGCDSATSCVMPSLPSYASSLRFQRLKPFTSLACS